MEANRIELPPLEPLTPEERASLAETYRNAIRGTNICRFALPAFCLGVPAWNYYMGETWKYGAKLEAADYYFMAACCLLALLSGVAMATAYRRYSDIVDYAAFKRSYRGMLVTPRYGTTGERPQNAKGAVTKVTLDNGSVVRSVDYAIIDPEIQFGDPVIIELAVPAGKENLSYGDVPLRVKAAR